MVMENVIHLSYITTLAPLLLPLRLAPVLISCIFLLVVAPLCFYFAYRNSFVNDVLFNGWSPVIIAMAISSVGGFILDIALKTYKGIAVFQPVMNGVGGNLVAVQASRISTSLHQSGAALGHLPRAALQGSMIGITCVHDSNP